MKAVIQETYGGPEVLEVRDIDAPVPGDSEILVRVRAASIHPGDWMLMRGAPYIVIRPVFGFKAPRKQIPGFDLAGIVESVGSAVTRFVPGDEVMGSAAGGSCAEYALCSEDELVIKPARLSFEQAATLPVSGSTALRGIRDAAKVQAGQTVLVNGASGGVGTYAIQIARNLGAEVTAVCSGRNAELVRSLGADDVIDYGSQDFTVGEQRYDVVFDNVGNHSLRRTRRAVAPGGTFVPNNGTKGGTWFGPIGRMLRAAFGSFVIPKQGRPFVSTQKQQDLADLAALVEAGDLTPVVGATYPLSETARAMQDVGDGHASGKIVIVP